MKLLPMACQTDLPTQEWGNIPSYIANYLSGADVLAYLAALAMKSTPSSGPLSPLLWFEVKFRRKVMVVRVSFFNDVKALVNTHENERTVKFVPVRSEKSFTTPLDFESIARMEEI
ncbi:uncharacterized protein [Watersipora subatra]|uniref:uncharacterized protein n=1 Tax=Watersipora subatra TaxID=2589382 RepID=UPI00355BFCA8